MDKQMLAIKNKKLFELLNYECDNCVDSYLQGKIEGLAGINCNNMSLTDIIKLNRNMKNPWRVENNE